MPVRYKVVPPVRDEAFLRDAHEALPLVPGAVESCCDRLRDRTDIPARDEAREWLTFLQALGLAVETDRGFHRVRNPPTSAELATAFTRRVFGARELLDALPKQGSETDERGDPVTDIETIFGALREEIPTWERTRETDWEVVWRERTERLLGWAIVFDLAERTEGGYHRQTRFE